MKSITGNSKIAAAISTILLAPSGSQIANAQTATESAKLEEVVVTAERRSGDLQKTAVSISVLNGEALQERGRTTLNQILEDVPGVNASATSFNSDNAGLNISIRGVPTIDSSGAAVSPVPTTAFYTDHVYEGIGGSYDIDRVEVLRGPQGTLYGRSATSGVVAVHTRDPVLGNFGGDVSAELGNYSLRHYTGAMNLPAGEIFAVRVAADQYHRDGYFTAEGDEVKKTSARIKMLYKPIEDLSVLVGAASEDNTVHSGGATSVLTTPDHFTYTPTSVLESKNFFRQYWANVIWNLGPATLTYIPSYRKWYQGLSGTAGTLAGIPTVANSSRPLDQFVTHELRLASNNPSARVTWLAGSFYYDNRLHYLLSFDFPQSGGYLVHNEERKETQDWGTFAEGTLHFTDTWRLTAGVRYDYTYVQTLLTSYTNPNATCFTPISFSGCSLGITPIIPPQAGTPVVIPTPVIVGPDTGTRRFYNVTYKGRVEHDLTPNNLMYAMISSGFLPGDVQISGTAPQTYAEETLTAFEIGSKNRFQDERLQINADVFYYRYGGYQRTVIPTGNPNVSYFATVPARMVGGEIEAIYQLTANDRLGLSYAYTDAYYIDKSNYNYTIQQGPTSTTYQFAENVSQRSLAGVVPQTLNLTYDHIFRLPGGSSVTAHADARELWGHYVSDLNQYYVNSGFTNYASYKSYVWIPSQTIANVSATWLSSNDRFSVTAYVRNVADSRYATAVTITASPVAPTSYTGTESDPRTYGVVLTAKF